MSRPLQPLNLRVESLGEDAPEWAIALCEQLNVYAQQVNEALLALPTVEQVEGVLFTTDQLGSAYVDVKNPLPAKPTGVVVDKLNAADNSPVANVYSWTWQSIPGAVRLLFIGLAASTRYRLAVSLK